jgi:hypothetical protein
MIYIISVSPGLLIFLWAALIILFIASVIKSATR